MPLSSRAREILGIMAETRPANSSFRARGAGQTAVDMALEMLLRRMKVDATVHGFRSAFRDWAAEQTSFPREVAEAALAHTRRTRSRRPIAGRTCSRSGARLWSNGTNIVAAKASIGTLK